MEGEIKKCKCGYTKESKIVVPRNKYSAFQWILWSIGISSTPKKVDLICPVCSFLFESLTDPERCNLYRYK